MRRRDFIKGIVGSAAVWPLVRRTQQQPAMPVIGFLSAGTFEIMRDYVAAFHRSLADGLCHLRAPSLLMRARALATVREWKKRLERQAHLRSIGRGGCGLPVATGAMA
jgi:hypothetical protein